MSRILALAGKEGKREAKALVHHASLLVAIEMNILTSLASWNQTLCVKDHFYLICILLIRSIFCIRWY